MDIFYKLQRYSDNGNSTQGLFMLLSSEKPVFKNYTLEDEHRDIKVSGETRIDAGLYEVKFREQDTPLTLRYRSKFDWFTYHLELQETPRHKYVYIHIGNDEDDTDACITVQDNANNNSVSKGFNSSSTTAFKRVYLEMSRSIEKGDRVFLRVCDEYELL